MIEQYLNGDMYLLQEQKETIGICIIVKKEQSIYEIKNIAIIPSKQQLGYG